MKALAGSLFARRSLSPLRDRLLVRWSCPLGSEESLTWSWLVNIAPSDLQLLVSNTAEPKTWESEEVEEVEEACQRTFKSSQRFIEELQNFGVNPRRRLGHGRGMSDSRRSGTQDNRPQEDRIRDS